MRKKKREKLIEEAFWSNFFYFNVPPHINEISGHIDRVNFRYYHANDEDLVKMLTVITSVYQLDLDGTAITNEGLRTLTQLENITEIRLKGCKGINDTGMEYICQLKGVTLLHLGNTTITTAGFENIGNLTQLKSLFISAAENDEALEEIYIRLPAGCEFIVNHKSFPFSDPEIINQKPNKRK